jgi:hypothetical protein
MRKIAKEGDLDVDVVLTMLAVFVVNGLAISSVFVVDGQWEGDAGGRAGVHGKLQWKGV